MLTSPAQTPVSTKSSLSTNVSTTTPITSSPLTTDKANLSTSTATSPSTDLTTTALPVTSAYTSHANNSYSTVLLNTASSTADVTATTNGSVDFLSPSVTFVQYERSIFVRLEFIRPVYDIKVFVLAEDAQTSIEGNQTEYSANITNLQPATTYTFTVEACVNDLCHNTTLTNITLPEEPTNCTAVSTSDTINISWTFDSTGVSAYKVENNGNPSNCTDVPLNHTVCVLQNLSSNTAYTLEIKSLLYYNCSNDRCEVESKPCTIETRTAPANPTSVLFENVTSTSLDLLWDTADRSTANIKYNVTLSKDNDIKNNFTFDKTMPFIGLKPGHLYYASVSACYYEVSVTDIEKYLCSATVYNTTYTIPEEPTNCTAVSTSDTINISWTLVSTVVAAFKVEKSGNSTNCADLLRNQTECVLENLSSNTAYTLEIKSLLYYNCSNRRCEVESKPCTIETRTAPANPRSVLFENVTSTSLNLLWDTADRSTADIIYNVTLSKANDIKNNFTSDRRMHFIDLKPGHLYHASVSACYNDSITDNEKYLCSVPIYNTSYTRPRNISSFSLVKAYSRKIQIQWKFTDSADFFIISGDRTFCKVLKSHTSITTDYGVYETNLTDGIHPAQIYHLKIKACVGNNTCGIETPPVLMYTLPEEPTNCTFFSASSNSVTISWNGVNTSVTSYSATCVDCPPTCTNISMDQTNCTFENLQSNIPYNVIVSTLWSAYNCSSNENCSSTRESNPCRVETRTAPAPPERISFSNYTEASLNVTWTNGDSVAPNISYFVQLSGDKNDSANTSDIFYVFSNLTSGSMYEITIISYYDKQLGYPMLQSNPRTASTYTRPSALKSLNVLAATESNITVEMTVANERYTTFEIGLNGLENDCSYVNKSTDMYNLTCTRLNASTTYTLEVATKIENLASLPMTLNLSTAPKTPEAHIYQVHTTTIQINLLVEESQELFYFYILKYNQTNDINETITIQNTTTSSTNFTINHLTPGTFYIVEVYSSFNGWHCGVPALLNSYTTPSRVRSISITAVNSTALNISWEAGEGNYENFSVGNFNCHSPDNGSFTTADQTTESLFVIKSELPPGSDCNASVAVHAGQQISEASFPSTGQSTLETAPSKVTELRFDTLVNTSHALEASWKEPSSKNGIIRAYRVIVKQNDKCTYTHLLNCSNCKQVSPYSEFRSSADVGECLVCNITTFNASQKAFHLVITNLEPYTNYSVNVSAFTTYEGPASSSENITGEDIPSAPGKPVLISSTPNSLTIRWEAPNKTNGLLREYRITYEYFQRMCRGYGNKISSNKTLNYSAETDIGLQNSSLYQLYPSWNYNISIEARTSKGYGSKSAMKSFMTAESDPGIINKTDVTVEAFAYNISLKWEPPCFSNGDIIYYNISWINNNSQPDRGNNVSGTTNITYINILPYRNYTFRIAAVNNNSQGRFTDEIYCRSSIAKPTSPEHINVTALSSTAIQVSWDQLKEEQYRGPTYYIVQVSDTVNETLKYSNISEGYNSTSCDFYDLDEYWNYTVKVTANTVDTSRNSTVPLTTESDENLISTKEDKPGPVRNIIAIPEESITKRRSITVEWQEPTVRDLNGILTKYYIRYYSYTGQIKTEETSPQKTRIVLESDIKTGLYNITVFAATKAGNGTLKNVSSVNVEPGAPLKPMENSYHRLVSKSSNNNVDSQRQLAVLLDRETFLCNTTNGPPVMWGVIVAQEDRATGSSFLGSRNAYKRRLSEYKRWIDIKDSENIEPYRATGDSWRPCSDFGPRLKRSSELSTSEEQKPYEFIVGNETDCKDKRNDLCNGQLPSGRSFRVKSFVCTEMGCTESQYSLPIQTAERMDKTDSAPNPTVAIVAGMISGVLVIACVLVVVFLKRKEKACFAKSIEESNFEPDLELKGTSKFRPGAVKLADFPAYVDALNKDSGLLFADGFRLLKEQSPSHPTTVAELQACRPKTRYTNILPFDHSRVKLLPLDDEEGSDFINANFIPGYTSRREYIATQGPLPATKDDFWRMVWEQNVDIIVMLTRCVEKGKRKCDEYWPEVVQEPVYSGDLIVNVQSESTLSDYVIRIIELKLGMKSHKVKQFHFLKWPDHGCPSKTWHLINFVTVVRQYRPPFPIGPVVVHCSAGVGRTGTFIAVDRLLQHIRDYDEVDVYNIILDMRNYRCNMVQTEDQFIYIYECIRDFITTDDEEEQQQEEHLYENTRFEQNIYENTAFQNE